MIDPGRRGTDALVDDAIDRVVGELMRVDAPPGMRARVLSRIDEPLRPSRTVPRVAAAAALAAVILLAFVFTRGPAPGPTPAQTAGTVPARAPAAPPTPLPSVAPAPTVARSDGGGREIRRPGTTSRSESRAADEDLPVEAFASTITIPPLQPIDPIVVAPLQSSFVAPEEIVIEPLTPLAELEIAPLFPSDD